MSVTEIESSNFEASVKSAVKVVVDCYAPWCGPCRMLAPVIEELADENENVKFFKLNVDNNEEVARKFGIMSIPTILYFENGALKEQMVGFRSKEDLEEIIK
ncbi:MAG: thioredoxin [Clostridiales bacterium]|nr:thioredoxin [Clostridiales bacterium]